MRDVREIHDRECQKCGKEVRSRTVIYTGVVNGSLKNANHFNYQLCEDCYSEMVDTVWVEDDNGEVFERKSVELV